MELVRLPVTYHSNVERNSFKNGLLFNFFFFSGREWFSGIVS